MEAWVWALLLSAGLLGGFLTGLLGIGGGTVYVLLLEELLAHLGVLLEELPAFVIANSLAVVLVSSASAAWALWRGGEWRWRPVLWAGVSSLVVSVCVSWVVIEWLGFSPVAFAWVLIVLLTYALIRMILPGKRADGSRDPDEVSGWLYSAGGGASGAVAALSGLGGGIVMVPLFHLVYRLSMHAARAASLGVILIASLGLSFRNLFGSPQTQLPGQLGYLIWPVAALLGLGVLIASPLGVRFARRVSGRALRLSYAAFLLLFLLKKTYDLLWL